MKNLLVEYSVAALRGLQWLLVVQVKVLATILLTLATIWVAWDVFAIYQTDGTLRARIPNHFVIDETLEIKRTALHCNVGVYSLAAFEPDMMRIRGTSFSDLLTGKPFSEWLDGVENGRFIANVVLDGKSCLHDSPHLDPMMQTLRSSHSTFTYRRGTVVAYNPTTNRLYVVAGGG